MAKSNRQRKNIRAIWSQRIKVCGQKVGLVQLSSLTRRDFWPQKLDQLTTMAGKMTDNDSALSFFIVFFLRCIHRYGVPFLHTTYAFIIRNTYIKHVEVQAQINQ